VHLKGFFHISQFTTSFFYSFSQSFCYFFLISFLRASIWGWLQSGDTSVTVSFNSKMYNAKVSDNEWRVDLDPTPAGGPHTILITGSGGSKAVLDNVLFGDVWICSGQSNMQFSLKAAFNSTEEIADADNFPNIRLFTVGQGNASNTPLQNLASIEEKWSVASSTSVGNGVWTYFSAVCWLYGKYLFVRITTPLFFELIISFF